jgi:C-terminal processing protease CtpA/Prc
MEFVTRDGRSIGMEPSRRWTKPSIVIASEGNYSDAHCFPWAYQHLAIGKVVGMPVAGTCSFVWWERLQDRRLVFGIPNLVVAGPDGRPLENQLLEPDIRIDNEPAALAGGIDQQLERAVAELLTGLGAH